MRFSLAVIALLLTSGGLAAGVRHLTEAIGLPSVLCWTLGILTGGVALVAIPVTITNWRGRRELNRKSTTQLQYEVFRFDDAYFESINALEDPAANRFRTLVQERDLANLVKEWPMLERRFLALEHEAGHEGRPLIMDFYYQYGPSVRLLHKRLQDQSS